jgi:hypothetical protein
MDSLLNPLIQGVAENYEYFYSTSINFNGIKNLSEFMAFEIKRGLTSEHTVKHTAKLISFFTILVIIYTIIVFVPPIKNSIEIQNGTFNYTSSATELQTAISAGNLLSSIVVAGATIIYAIFTYFILDATNKNTLQSALSIRQTANFQRIEYLERRLENFYLPMENALQKVNLDSIGKWNKKVVENENSPHALYFLIQIWCSFREDYDKIAPFIYLASEEVKVNIGKFTNIVLSNSLFSEKFTEKFESAVSHHNNTAYKINEYIEEGLDREYLLAVKPISNYHSTALAEIKKDIKSISEELAELVNQ